MMPQIENSTDDPNRSRKKISEVINKIQKSLYKITF